MDDDGLVVDEGIDVNGGIFEGLGEGGKIGKLGLVLLFPNDMIVYGKKLSVVKGWINWEGVNIDINIIYIDGQ